jgi:hypothetical protein
VEHRILSNFGKAVAPVGILFGFNCRRRSRDHPRRFDHHRRKSRGRRRHLPQSFPPPLVDQAGADIGPPRHFRHHRPGLGDLRQNPRPLVLAPMPPPLAARHQRHPTHAVQLASLIKPTYLRSITIHLILGRRPLPERYLTSIRRSSRRRHKVSAADGRSGRSEGVARPKLRPAVGDPKRPTPAESHLSFAGSCSEFRNQLCPVFAVRRQRKENTQDHTAILCCS